MHFLADLHTLAHASTDDANFDSRTITERPPQLPAETFSGSSSGCSAESANGVPETREESHQGPPGSGKIIGRSTDNPRRGVGRAHPAHQLLEVIFGRSSEELDRLCQTLRTTRASPSDEDYGRSRSISRGQRMPGRFQDLSWPSDRDQRRGGDDWRLRDVGHANQRKHPDALQLSDETIQGCGVDPSGGAISQATQNRRKLSCRRCQAAPRCKAAFQLGGLYMTLWYCSRKPDLLDLPAVAAMKWSHSIMREPDFCCECGAREAAQMNSNLKASIMIMPVNVPFRSLGTASVEIFMWVLQNRLR